MILNSDFVPAMGLSNPHAQTLFSNFMRKSLSFDGFEQTFILDDGDHLTLVWTENLVKPKSSLGLETQKPIVIVFHGLEGSIESSYAKGMMLAIKKQGWIGLFMHFRSCAEKMNSRPNLYHSGETNDAKELITWLGLNYPNYPLAAIGFSLGGNMLLKLQAELGVNSPLKAVVGVSVPLLLSMSAQRINKGFSKLYQQYLLGLLKQKLLLKSQHHNYEKLIGLKAKNIKKFKTIFEFDQWVTAPLYGFQGAEDYYNKCSSRQYLKNIAAPALIIQALDDPFMILEMIPKASELSPHIKLELSNHGGHVGFISGSFFKPNYWLELRIPNYLSQFI